MSYLDDITISIGNVLAAKLHGFAFVKSCWHLIKRSDQGWQAVAIRVLRTQDPDLVMLDAHARVRIDAVEQAYAPFHAYLTVKSAKNHPTLVQNCIELLADKSLIDGFRTDVSSVEKYANSYSIALRGDVLPWLKKYSDEQGLFEGLSDDDPTKWITSDRLTRYPVLLAILARRGEWSKFERIANEFTKYCGQPHAEVHKPFAESMIAGLKGRFLN